MTTWRRPCLLLTTALLTSSLAAQAQTAPTLDPIPDPPAILEDSGLQTVSLSGITDGGDGGQTLTVTASSDNAAVIPDPTTTYSSPDATGSLDYTPVSDASGAAVITVTVDDGVDSPVSKTFTVTVDPVDDAPVAVADAATVTEDDPAAVIDVLGNDTDVDGGPKTIVSATDPAGGTVVVAGDGLSLTYEPDADFCNDGAPTDDFSYELNGGSTAPVSVTVDCVDDAPVAVADAATVTEDDPAAAIDVLGNDTDVDGGPKTIVSATDPAGGTVVVAGDGLSLTYEPDADFCNDGAPTDDFSYELNGGSTAPVSVTVDCVDDAPVAVADAATVTEDDPAAVIDVLGNDTDVDGGPKTIVSATDPAGGTVVVAGDGLSLTYQPDPDYCSSTGGGTDDFSYELNGGSTAIVSVTVDCTPDAADDTATVDEDSAANPIDVLANDDIGDPAATVTAVGDPANGSAAINGTADGVEYSPDSGYCNTVGGGTDDFTYTVTDDDGDSSTATVSVTVDCAPDAVDDTATVDEDSVANPIVVLDDDDLGDEPTTVTAVSDPANGSAAVNGSDDGVEYTPDPDYCNTVAGGSDDFTYTITDDDGDSSTATVSVTVDCAPDAAADVATVDEDSVSNPIAVLANDDTGDPVASVTAVDDPANGTAAISGGGSGIEYTPDPEYCNTNTGVTDDFTYTVADADGDADTATVAVTVTCVNDAPSFIKGPDQTTAEDSGAQSVTSWASTILAGPANESDQAVAFTVTGNTNPALFAAGPAVSPAGDLSYTPAANAFGSADLTITISDDCAGATPPASCGTSGVDTSAPQTFKITVDNVNDAPTFISGGDVITETGTGEQAVPWATGIDVGPANENQTAAFTVTSTTCNPDPITAGPVVDPDGTLRFTPLDNQTGSCSISVKLSDGVDETSPVTFTLTLVTASRPIADPQTVETDGGNALTIVLTGSDPDDQTPLAFQILEPVTDTDTGAIVSDTGPFRGTLDTTTPATNPDGVSADVVYTPDGPSISTAVILASESVLIRGAAVLTGDVVVNEPGGTMQLLADAMTPAGFAVKADSLDVADDVVVGGDALCNAGDYAPSCAPLALPAFDPGADPLPPFLVGSVGDADATAPKNGNSSIGPGLYRDLVLGKNSALHLAAGKYSVRSIRGDNGATLSFGGPVEIRVAERVLFDNNSTIGTAGSAGEVVFYVAGADGTGKKAAKAFEAGNNSLLWANVYAPNGTIFLQENVQATGAFIARHVEVQNNAAVAGDYAFSDPPDQFAFEVTDDLGLVSRTAIVEINPDAACRDASGQIVAIAAYDGSAATDGAPSIDITLRGCESSDVPVTVTAAGAMQGTLSGVPAGPVGPPYEFVVTYTPDDPVPNNRDSFSFAFDNGVSSATATVEINEPPCSAIEASTASNQVATNAADPLTLTLSACDPDDGIAAFTTTPAPGGAFAGCASCDLSAPVPVTDNRPGYTSVSVTLTHSEPAATLTGFDFTATAASGSDTATVDIEVNPANVAPDAVDDAFSGSLGGTVTGNVLGNDTDLNLDSLAASLVGPTPAQASVFTLNPDGSFVYTHNGTANLSDSFQYAASDGTLSDTATVSITLVAATIDVTVIKAGPGALDSLVASAPAGISCGAGCTSQSVSFTTTENIRLTASAASGFVFDGWTGPADCVDGSIVPLTDVSCTANFSVDTTTPPSGDPILVTLLKDGTGAGTVTSSPAGIACGPSCPSQTATITGAPRITLEATAAPGSIFVGFAGGPGGNDCEDAELEAVVDTTCSATFSLAQRTLTINYLAGAGTVNSTPGGINCAGEPCSGIFVNGQTVTLSGRPDSGSPSSVLWGGDCVPDATFPFKATVQMTADATCTVVFP